MSDTPFEPGEKVLLIDQRDRTYLFTLQAGGTYHTHSGTLAHDDAARERRGHTVETSKGMVLVAFRPRFADFVLKMPRGAQVVYPKDLGPIVTYADIFPGARVLEAGTGSGALTIALCRAAGTDGRVVSYELRDEHQAQAVANIEAFFGKVPPSLDLRTGDLEEVAEGTERFDRAVLDLPEPWAPLEALARRPGARRRPRGLPADDDAGAAARARLARARLPPRGDVRDAEARLARHRAERSPRSPDGGPHRVPFRRTPPGLTAAEHDIQPRQGLIRRLMSEPEVRTTLEWALLIPREVPYVGKR